MFRAKIRNKHARVLALRQATSLETWREYFVDRVNRKGYELYMLSQNSR